MTATDWIIIFWTTIVVLTIAVSLIVSLAIGLGIFFGFGMGVSWLLFMVGAVE